MRERDPLWGGAPCQGAGYLRGSALPGALSRSELRRPRSVTCGALTEPSLPLGARSRSRSRSARSPTCSAPWPGARSVGRPSCTPACPDVPRHTTYCVPTFSHSSFMRIFGWFCWPSAKGFIQSGHWAMHGLRVAERDGRGWEPGSCPDSGRGRALIVGMAGPPPRGHPHGRAFRDWGFQVRATLRSASKGRSRHQSRSPLRLGPGRRAVWGNGGGFGVRRGHHPREWKLRAHAMPSAQGRGRAPPPFCAHFQTFP